jgi:hypothetical protein
MQSEYDQSVLYIYLWKCHKGNILCNQYMAIKMELKKKINVWGDGNVNMILLLHVVYINQIITVYPLNLYKYYVSFFKVEPK